MAESSSSSSSSAAAAAAAAEDRRAKFFEEFYSLKQKYEEKKREMEKTSKKPVVPLCVNCGKPGGTLFSIKNGHFLAICRASGKKCGLHMELNRGNYFPTRELVFKYQDILDRARENIIVMKNNVEFGYGGGGERESTKAFEEENAHYESARKRIEALRASLGDAEREAEKRDIMRQLGELRRVAASREKNNVLDDAAADGVNNTMEYIEDYRDKVMPLVERLRNLNLEEPYIIPPTEGREGLGSFFHLTRGLL
jgi:hypothetical protein